jgi:large subunit ribosomal protein L3
MLGLIGKKLDMTQIFDANGAIVPVTAIQVEPNVVVGLRTPEKNGYSAVVLGVGTMKKNRVRKPYGGQFPEGVEPTRVLREFRDYDREAQVGEKLGVELFEGTPFVDVRGVSKGKGFQGVMKRHGFHGGRKTHGSKFHREPASTGFGFMARVWPGSRMPGRMGGVQKAVQNLRIIRVDREKGLLLVRGAIPGPRGCTVVVTRARKK